MHQDIITGCKHTESQANRFASAFLLPRSSFSREFVVGQRMDWRMLKELKKRWGVSKAALLYRARQLDLLSESRYKSSVITLRKYEAKKEKDDYLINFEKSELISDAITNFITVYGKTVDDLLDELNVNTLLLNKIIDFNISEFIALESNSNVISLAQFANR